MVNQHRANHPPRIALALISLFAARPDRAFLLGDLAEEFQELATDRGENTASRWYWNQTLRSAVPLLVSRLATERMGRSVGAMMTGIIAAIASATAFGVILEKTLQLNDQATLPVIALVVTACALVSSTCAGCASTWVSGNPYRWARLVIGLVVVAPDLAYAMRYHGAEDLPWVLVPPVLAILATSVGLVLGRRLCHLTYVHS